MTYRRKEVIGDCTLYLGDCLDVIPTLGKVDAVVTDPPYGLGIDGQKRSISKTPKHNRKEHEFLGWDSARPCRSVFNMMQDIAEHHIIWGGNYFIDMGLGCTKGWLVWDKAQYGLTMSDGELAYTSLNKPLRIFSKNRACLIAEETQHPTQKPITLMKWCIEQLPEDCDTILDPFMGSGTTGVACAKMGRKFIGIELEPKYFDIACNRIEEAYKQPDMFVKIKKEELKQEVMEL